MIAHLSKPEYVHLLLNPLPVYGLAVGVLGLVIALSLRTRGAHVTVVRAGDAEALRRHGRFISTAKPGTIV